MVAAIGDGTRLLVSSGSSAVVSPQLVDISLRVVVLGVSDFFKAIAL